MYLIILIVFISSIISVCLSLASISYLKEFNVNTSVTITDVLEHDDYYLYVGFVKRRLNTVSSGWFHKEKYKVGDTLQAHVNNKGKFITTKKNDLFSSSIYLLASSIIACVTCFQLLS